VHPRKQWSYAGHPSFSGEHKASRIDVGALGLVPLELRDEGDWDPSEEYWGEEGEPIADWASAIIQKGLLDFDVLARGTSHGQRHRS
jgi:hypothetical protein